MPEDTCGDLSGDAVDPLESAIAFIGRNARTTGEESFSDRQTAAIAQLSSLVEWAAAGGLILNSRTWESRSVIGGSEHDIWEEPGEYWKSTRDNHFGWTVLPGDDGKPLGSEATPLEYLERWNNANLFLGDRVQLRGIVKTKWGVRIVISQPFVEGRYPNKTTISKDLVGRGFRPLPGFVLGAEMESSFYHPDERIGLFDAATDNFILSQGVPVPVDVVILQAGEALHYQLCQLI